MQARGVVRKGWGRMLRVGGRKSGQWRSKKIVNRRIELRKYPISTISDEKQISIWVNPLQFLEADETWAGLIVNNVTSEAVLEFICTPGIGSDLNSIISRYKKISVEKKRIFAAPNEQRILDKLIWPLRHAKAGYICGNYLGTIALCGMVAEMVAILLFEISNSRLNDRPMSDNDQVSLFGSKFEKLGQDRRIQILSVYGIINDDLKKAFEDIRLTRKRYLHLWSQDHDRLPVDAEKSFQAAVLIVVSVIGQDVREGILVLNPAIVNYLEKSGVFMDKDTANI